MHFIRQGFEQLGSSVGFIFLLSLMEGSEGRSYTHSGPRGCPLPSCLGDGEG